MTRQRRHLRDLIVIAGVTTDRHLLESLLSDIRQMRFVTAGEAG